MNVKQIIEELQRLDLSKYPWEEVMRYLSAVGRVAVIEQTLHAGKIIVRARPHSKDDEIYTTRKSLSYKPQEYNKTYQRASTPNRTMFYGSVIAEDLEGDELDNERVIVSVEALEWLRNNKTCGTKELTYSRWQVENDIKLVAIIHHDEFYNASSLTRKMVTDFHTFVSKYPEVKEPSILISTYLASEFAKEETYPDYKYLISACFTELMCSRGFDGVFYPSVRMNGNGFNVAITPEAVDSSLKLLGAGRCKIYKRYEKSVVDNIDIAYIDDQEKPFNYTNLPERYRGNEVESLRRLGVTTVDELCLGI